jgi:hypothetical protein
VFEMGVLRYKGVGLTKSDRGAGRRDVSLLVVGTYVKNFLRLNKRVGCQYDYIPPSKGVAFILAC